MMHHHTKFGYRRFHRLQDILSYNLDNSLTHRSTDILLPPFPPPYYGWAVRVGGVLWLTQNVHVLLLSYIHVRCHTNTHAKTRACILPGNIDIVLTALKTRNVRKACVALVPEVFESMSVVFITMDGILQNISLMIIINVFLKRTFLSLETILSPYTHKHRHLHTQAFWLYRAKYTQLKMGILKLRYHVVSFTFFSQMIWVHINRWQGNMNRWQSVQKYRTGGQTDGKGT